MTQTYEHWTHEVGSRVFTSRTLWISSRPRPHALFRSQRTLSILLKGFYRKSINDTLHKLFLHSRCIYIRHIKIWFHVYEGYESSIQQLTLYILHISYKYTLWSNSVQIHSVFIMLYIHMNLRKKYHYMEKDIILLSNFTYIFSSKFEIINSKIVNL